MEPKPPCLVFNKKKSLFFYFSFHILNRTFFNKRFFLINRETVYNLIHICFVLIQVTLFL